MEQLVTVCIATYNRENFLPKAIASVLQQSYSHLELIIVDDCSADHTEKVVSNFLSSDPRIKYIRHAENKGLAAARNTAIKAAAGKYFTFIDDDDTWNDYFIEEFVNLAENYDDNWCFCCGNKRYGRLGKINNRYSVFEGKLIDYCKQGYAPPVAAQFYYLDSLKKVGGYNENIKTGVDHDLWLSLAFSGVHIKSLNKCLAFINAGGDTQRKRMTNQYEKRLSGIQKSLRIWKDNIVQSLGEEFYHKFCKAYLLRERKEFLKSFIMDFNFKGAFQVYKDIKKSVSMKELLKTFLVAMLYQGGIRVKKEITSVRTPDLQII